MSEITPHDGYACPCCRSGDLDGQPYDLIGETVFQTVVCNNCGASWEDVYRLVGYENLKECKE